MGITWATMSSSTRAAWPSAWRRRVVQLWRPNPPHPVTENVELLTASPRAVVKVKPAPSSGWRTRRTCGRRASDSWSESDTKSLIRVARSHWMKPRRSSRTDHTSRCRWRWTHRMHAPLRLALRGHKGDLLTGRSRLPARMPEKTQMRIRSSATPICVVHAAAGIQGNADLFVNMNNWLTQQEDLISIHPRDAGDRRITMTADQQRTCSGSRCCESLV